MSAGNWGNELIALIAGPAPAPYPCFACGAGMMMELLAVPEPGWSGWCPRCEVAETRRPWVSRTAAITSVRWDGQVLRYVDHGAEHRPSPA